MSRSKSMKEENISMLRKSFSLVYCLKRINKDRNVAINFEFKLLIGLGIFSVQLIGPKKMQKPMNA